MGTISLHVQQTAYTGCSQLLLLLLLHNRCCCCFVFAAGYIDNAPNSSWVDPLLGWFQVMTALMMLLCDI
jgi:hypothetical protein